MVVYSIDLGFKSGGLSWSCKLVVLVRNRKDCRFCSILFQNIALTKINLILFKKNIKKETKKSIKLHKSNVIQLRIKLTKSKL